MAQDALLQSGPMVGYSAMREVMLWVQTKSAATVHVEYYDPASPAARFKTEEVTTARKNAYVAHLIADQVEPGKKYTYELFINKKPVKRPYPLQFQTQTLWQYRTDPPTVRFALGSCTYINEEQYDRPGRAYGGEYEIFTSIHKMSPDFMLWLGDNIYLREADWDSRTGILKRNTHTRSLPELQPLLGATHHYAIWDDHDFGPNDSDRSYWGKDLTLEAFKLFWGNPNYGVAGGGITGSFAWADLEFFLLDNRYFRTPNNDYDGPREILGKQQIEWLVEALVNSRAPFKFVAIGGQVLNSAAVYENHATYPEEREYLLRKIREAKIEGVIFLDGDRHHTELSMMKENDKVYPLYDLTVSPLTSSSHTPRDEGNVHLVPDTMIGERNFGMIEVSGPRKERKMVISIYDKDGTLKWSREIKAADLVYGE